MSRIDRIAEPWGTRTPYGPGETWPTRVDSYLADGLTEDDVDRWVQSATILHSQRRRPRHRRQGRPDRRRPRPGGGPGEPRPARPEGPLRLAGQQLPRPAHPAAGPARRRAGRDRLGHRDGRRGRAGCRELLDEQGPSAIGFYTTGQLFIEDYYTLGLIAHGGIGTNHVDGNTRLCTATAAAALKESFACDGQPGSYTDVDHADVIALYGHNVAETQTVLWTRILDRLAGPNPPRAVCVDPRLTPVARAATVHLAPRPGTNVMLMNALLHEILRNGWYDRGLRRRTRGRLRRAARSRWRTTRRRPPRRSATSPRSRSARRPG